MPVVDAATTALLRQDFDLPQGSLRKAELLEWLSKRVEELLRTRPEYFTSLCYTLDIDQSQLALALQAFAPAAPPVEIARLLYERQCARARTKATHPVPPLASEDAW